jgi:flagellar M-ring protein FliF
MAAATQNLVNNFVQLPARNKAGAIFGVATLIALIAGALLWGRTPDYKILYTNLSDRDGGAVLAALTQMNVPYKFQEGGGAVLVPAEMVHDARLRLASQGLPKGSIVGFELLESQKLGATQFQEQINYQRGLEGELARSIQSVASVQSARVHLAIPKASAFLRDQQKPTASVLVALHPGRTLDRAQVAGIVHLIASSVPELNPKQVNVLDQSGNLLSTQHEGIGLDPQQLGYLKALEEGFNKRILDILEPIVGPGNVRAQVTADVDFSLQESTAETYKPNPAPDQTAIRSQSINENTNGSSAQAQGVPGAASNQPGATAGQNTPGAVNGKKESVVNYEIDKTIRHQKNPTGVIRRLSAAVVVNHRRATGADGKVTLTALTKEQMDQLNALTREAMGFTKDRGDSLNVANAAFNTEELPPAAEVPLWRNPEYLSLAKEGGKALGALLAIFYVLFGIVRPLVRQVSAPPLALSPASGTATATEPALAFDRNGQALAVGASANPQLDAPRQITQTDPKIVANVIRTWVAKE